MESNKVQPQENKMGTMNMVPLLVSVSLPIVFSMLVQSMYNIVDSIFVARLSEQALTAVTLVYPIQNLMFAVAVGTGVGINSLLSRRLGEKNYESANKVAVNGMFLSVVSWLLFVVIGIVFTQFYFSGYRTNPEIGNEIADLGVTYMRIVTISSLGVFGSVIMERLLQATGRSVLSMVSQMAGAITNVILDPIMIFGLLGFPKMGIAGAAWATVIGQFVSMFLALFFNLRKNKEIEFRFKGFRPHLRTIGNIYQVGLPSILMQSIGSIMIFTMNKILVVFGSTAVSVFGIYFNLQSFVFLPVLGFNNGMVPIVAYNYGARKLDRIYQAMRIGMISCFILMLLGTGLFWLATDKLLGLFDANQQMLDIGIRALRRISVSFPIAAFVIIISGVFQALGKGVYSLILSAVRQLVFLLPIAWVLSRVSGLNAVWYAFLISEIAALILAIYLFKRVNKSTLRPIRDKSVPLEAPTAVAFD